MSNNLFYHFKSRCTAMLLLAALLLCPEKSYSLPIEKIGMENNLSSNYISSIAEDKRGFLWIGTDWGLNCFDGNKMRVFKTDDTDVNSLGGNGINMLLYDEQRDWLWIATKRNGLNVFDCRSERFVRYPPYTDDKNSPQAYGITGLALDGDDNLWMTTHGNGLKKLYINEDSVVHYNSLNMENGSTDISYLSCIINDNKGNFFIGHVNNGLTVIHKSRAAPKHYMVDLNKPKELPGNSVLTLYTDSNNDVWIGTSMGLALYRRGSDDFIVFRHNDKQGGSLSDNTVRSICEIEGKLWIGTDKGVNILDLSIPFDNPEQVQFEKICANDLPDGLSNGCVNTIFKDSFGNVWIGTNRGLNFMGHTRPYFNTIKYSPIKGDANSLSGVAATGLCYDNKRGVLWVGAENAGIDLYRGDEKIAHYCVEKGNLPDNAVFVIHVDKKENVWAGSSSGLLRYRSEKDCFERVNCRTADGKVFDALIDYLYEDNKGDLWVATPAGAYRYFVQDNRIEYYDVAWNSVRAITQDKKGNIWIAYSLDGLFVVSDGEQMEVVRHFQGKINSTGHLFTDSEGNVWACTLYGLSVFSYSGDSIENYTIDTTDGLPDNNVHAIVEDGRGEMWISTNAGICRYSKSSTAFESYEHFNGTLYDFGDRSAAISHEGTIYFGSKNGVCYFNSEQNFANNDIPRVIITDFSYFDVDKIKPGNAVTVPVSNNVELRYNQNTFVIGFNVMDYSLKDMVEYSYCLKGVDDSWYTVKGEPQVTFRNVPYGSYLFQVRGRIKNQSWSESVTTMQIEIVPPLWLSWWAKILYGVLALLLIVWLIRFYKKRVDLESQLYLQKENNAREQNLNDERLRFYTNVAHELRTPLTLIVGPLEDLLKNGKVSGEVSDELSLIYRSTNRLAVLVNQILEFRRCETNNRTLIVCRGDLSAWVKETGLKYRDLNQNRNLQIEISVEDDCLLFFDKEVVAIVLDNLISNATKYTVKGSVKIFLRIVERDGGQWAEVEIRDTGCGIEEKKLDKIFERYFQIKQNGTVQGTGIGLSLVKNLAQLHHAQIDVKSRVGVGTSFFFRLNLNEDYPNAEHREERLPQVEIERQGDELPTLLAVEDNPDILEYIKRSLSDSFTVITACDGQEGVKMAVEYIPDIIVSDIMMPVMDGISLCKTVKEDVRTSHIPVILLTAKDSIEDKTEGYSMGADSYITKPFSVGLLKSRIANLMELRKKMLDFVQSNSYKKMIASDSMSRIDSDFLRKTVEAIEKNVDSENINMAFLADQLCMSHSTFYRKIKAVTGITANEFVRKIKMQYAVQLMLSHKYTVSEVAARVGYGSISSFRTAFKSEYGVIPSKYLENLKDEEEKKE